MVVLAYVLISLHIAISVGLGIAIMMQMSKSMELGGALEAVRLIPCLAERRGWTLWVKSRLALLSDSW